MHMLATTSYCRLYNTAIDVFAHDLHSQSLVTIEITQSTEKGARQVEDAYLWVSHQAVQKDL